MMVYGRYDKLSLAFHVVSVDAHPANGRWDAMEVHWRAGSRAPVPGDRLAVWIDVTTPYAMAPLIEFVRKIR